MYLCVIKTYLNAHRHIKGIQCSMVSIDEWKTSCQLSSNLGKQNLSHLRKDRFGVVFS